MHRTCNFERNESRILLVISRSNFKCSQLCRIISTTPASILNVSAISHAFETFPKINFRLRHHLLRVIYYLFFEFITWKLFLLLKKETKKKIKNLTLLPQLSESSPSLFRFAVVKLPRSLSKRFAKVLAEDGIVYRATD